MIICNNVKGTMETVISLEVNVDTVYVRKNIIKVEGDSPCWEYDEIQYAKNEYIQYIAEQYNFIQQSMNDLILGGI